MEDMQLRDYKKALCAHFEANSSFELRRSEKWQQFAQENEIHELGRLNDWKRAYEAVFLANSSSETDTISEGEASSEDVAIEVVSYRRWDIEASQAVPEDLASFTELQNQEGQSVGALLQYSPIQSQALIDHFRSLSLHSSKPWHQGQLSSAIVDQLGATSSLVATGLQAGQLMRVIGPPELVAGLANGAYKMVQTATGSIGTVSATGGKFVGQLRFAQASTLPILAPVLAFQVLHMIVGTQQLNQINQRLANMERTLQALHIRQEAQILGEIHYAINVLDDILEERVQTGVFTADASNRLALVEKSILSILERNRLLVESFREKAKQAKSRNGKKGARNAAELLKSDGSQAIHDMQCLVGLIAADLKLEQALILLAMQNNPADVARRQERISSKMQSHQQAIANLPSIEEIKRHAQVCLQSMKWWEKIIDFGQTSGEVQNPELLKLQDVKPQFAALQPSLKGYVFWKDEEGTHVFAMSGDDLQIQPTGANGKAQKALEAKIKDYISPGKSYRLLLPESDISVRVSVEREVEPGLWFGRHPSQIGETNFLLRHVDYATVNA
ncbi:hypothetical protein H6F76_16300 [Leptolyngbya sp. FACHB-321]|uniref:hypothetical protein n=1 Tax=Leptolyngbya sp. FACHB-321 TaxID=2692807 RepID=UPI001682D25C|nr:hypothetical protein [Leptolyngbya sp. FACHB-321]MBD2036574.1 hypothetical protein [Leptolyngbya sp. FACHB-321]